MKCSQPQASLISDVLFQISLKGYSDQIVDTYQKSGLKENTIKSLSHFGFHVERIPSYDSKSYRITKL
jgi:hypothetical protein